MKRFHLAINTNNLNATTNFYKNVFDLEMQNAENHLYIDFYGTILAFYEDKKFNLPKSIRLKNEIAANKNHFVDCFHFGTFELTKAELIKFVNNAKKYNYKIIIEPTFCNRDNYNEQIFAFIEDPNGYALELRTITNKMESVSKINNYMQQNKDFKKENI